MVRPSNTYSKSGQPLELPVNSRSGGHLPISKHRCKTHRFANYLWIHDRVASSRYHCCKNQADLPITCEFTIRWPLQLISPRLQDISISSDYLWIHDRVAPPTHQTQISRHQHIFRLPVNSRSGGLSNSSHPDFKTSAYLQITCEFTIGWPLQLISLRLQDSSWSSDYLWIHDQVAQSTNLKKTWGHQLIFRLPVNSRSGGPFNSCLKNLKMS